MGRCKIALRPDDGMLRPINRTEPRPLCTAQPPQFDPSKYNIVIKRYEDGAPQPVDKSSKPSEPPKRAGWLGGFLGR
jgi:hypothetical protein